MRSFLTALLLMALLFGLNQAAAAFEIAGRVTAGESPPHPLGGVTVVFLHDGAEVGSASTGSNGEYAFQTDCSDLEIVYDHPGYTGKIVPAFHLTQSVVRLPGVRLVSLKEQRASGTMDRVLELVTEVYTASGRDTILIEKLHMLERESGESFLQALNRSGKGFDITLLLKKAIACTHGPVIEFLLARGVDVNLRDRQGNTLLHMATLGDNEEMVKLLLEKGADINAKDSQGRTPLHIAGANNYRELILLFLAGGARQFERDNEGKLPLAQPAEKETGGDRLFRIRDGSASPVTSLCFSPGGRFLVSGSRDGIVRIWDPASGKLLAHLLAHKGPITSLSFPPGGSCIASGSEDGSVILWEWSADTIPRKTLRHASPVRSLCFSEEGKYLISGCADGTVTLWNVHAAEPVGSCALQGGAVNALCLSADSKYILAGSADGTLQSIEMRGLRNPSILNRSLLAIDSLCISPGGRYVVSGDRAGEIVIIDLYTHKKSGQFHGHEGPVRSVLYSPGGRFLVSGGRDGSIRFRDTVSWKEASPLYRGSSGMGCIRYSPGSKHLVAGCDDGSITIMSALTGKVLVTMVGFADREWISLTPDLYFNCSLEGARSILLQSKGESVTLEQYRTIRRSSRMVKDSLEEKMSQFQASALPDPPGVTIVSPSEGASIPSEVLPLKVRLSGASVKTLLVLLNGRPVKNEGITGASLSPESGTTAGEVSVSVPLQPGINRIQVVAISGDEVRSLPDTVVVSHLYPHAVLPERLFLLSVGVNDYGDKKLNLDYAAGDAKAVEEFFASMKGLLFREVKTFTLLDSAARDRDVIRALKEIEKESTERDLVVVFLAGHGVRNEHDQFFFLCQKGNPDDVSENALSWSDFQQALGNLRAKNVLLLIDACHSGSLLKAESPFVSNDSLAEDMLGVIVFAACRGNEPSAELPGLGGAFTQSLLSGLHGKALPEGRGEGRITLFQTERYVTELVPRITGNRQHPVILKKEGIDDLPLSVCGKGK